MKEPFVICPKTNKPVHVYDCAGSLVKGITPCPYLVHLVFSPSENKLEVECCPTVITEKIGKKVK